MPFVPPPSQFIRVASIEIRVTNSQEYTSIAGAYHNNLGEGYAIKNGLSFGSDSLEMRILQVAPAPESVVNSRTIVYWQVKGTSHHDIQDVYNELIRSGKYVPYLSPVPDGLHGNDRLATERGVLLETTSSTPSLVGVVINPPYPRDSDPDSLFRWLLGAAASLVSLFLGWRVLGGFFPRPFKSFNKATADGVGKA